MEDWRVQNSENGISKVNGTPHIDIDHETTLYNDEIQEIISYKPVFFVRYGIAIFFVIIISLLASTFFIDYPDIIKAPVKINGVNAPKLLVSKVNGKLTRLRVPNEMTVSKGMVIAFFESTADHEQVLNLKAWIDKTEYLIITGDIIVLQTTPLPMLTGLGEIQPAYQDFQNTLKQTLQTLDNGFFQQKRAALLKDIEYVRQAGISISKQKDLLQQDYLLQKTEYEMNERLAHENVITPIDFNREKSKLLTKEQAIEQMKTVMINNATLMQSKYQQLSEVEKNITDQRQSFQAAFLTLKSKVSEWVQHFIVIAPENGKVQYVSFLEENQILVLGQALFYLIPEQGQFFAELAARQENVGKVRLNQDVIIKLAGYPYQEFGTLKGKVTYIPNVPLRDSVFLIKVDLPRGLTTTHNKTLHYKNNLLGQAEIITDNQKLSDKLLHQFYKLFER